MSRHLLVLVLIITVLRSTLAEAPPNPADTKTPATKPVRQRKVTDADLVRLEAAAKDQFDDFNVVRALGDAYLARGQADRAVALYRRFAATHRDDWRGTIALSDALNKSGKPSEVEKLLVPLLKTVKPTGPLRVVLADAYLARDRYRDAFEQLDAAIAEKPDFFPARFRLGNLLVNTGEYPRAVKAYQRALRLDPDAVNVRYNLAGAYMLMGRWASASATYRKVIAVNPDAVLAHLNLGDALVRQKRYSSARASYQRAIEINPKFARAHANLALVHCHFRDYAKARAQVEICQALGQKVKPELLEALDQAAARAARDTEKK